MIQLFLLGAMIQVGQSGFHQSVAEMGKLVEMEKQFLHGLQRYFSLRSDIPEEMKSFILMVDDSLKEVNTSNDIETYLGCPMNSYLTLVRFRVGWPRIKPILRSNRTNKTRLFIKKHQELFDVAVNQSDIVGAMEGLYRLQLTYDLEPEALVKDVTRTVQRSDFYINSTFHVGAYGEKKKSWLHVKQWFSYALDCMGDRDVSGEIKREAVLDHLFAISSMMTLFSEASSYVEELVRFRPNDLQLKSELGSLKRKIASGVAQGFTLKEAPVQKHYKDLCKGVTGNLTEEEQNRLLCWYQTRNPLLILKPQKVERLWTTPDILLFHDILTDTESQFLKDTSLDHLEQAGIEGDKTGDRARQYRLGKNHMVRRGQEVRKLERRFGAVTHLNATTAEEMQVLNYGIGGMYGPHYDAIQDDYFGSRIATLLLYLSNVTSGGATIFTVANAAIFPVKNAGVFWYNLLKSGRNDAMTRHSGCPVITGQKWIANVWFRELGQEFRRPCGLSKDL